MALIGSLGEIDLGALDASIADTAVDVFVYDTRKDSDGGAWRKRTQHTSWYNETLNTATRGSRREFPAVAVIVTETGKVTIYDGDDPDLPMWMVFETGSTSAPNGNMISAAAAACDNTAVSALNGILCVTIGVVQQGGLHTIKFISEENRFYREGPSSFTASLYKGNIAERNDAKGHSGDDDTLAIVNQIVNDVAMTVLPNAPIDDATGLPIPTIAVATNGGFSVIKDDGTVIDKAVTGTVTNKVDWYKGQYLLGTGPEYWGLWKDLSEESSGYISGHADLYSAGNNSSWDKPQPIGQETKVLAVRDLIAGGSTTAYYSRQPGLSLKQPTSNLSNGSSNLLCEIRKDYNTGWMYGDIKGAFLSDTDATNVTGTELVTNGTFDTDTSGWSSNRSATLSVSSGALRVTNTSLITSGAHYQISTEIGKEYVFSFDVLNTSAFNAYVGVTDSNTYNGGTFVYGTGAAYAILPSGASYSGTFIAAATTYYIHLHIYGGTLNGGFLEFDNVSVRLAEEDRSINNNGLQVFGTVTKSAVATGAELVAYSGWSSSNYLRQPYNSDLDFGTGNWCYMFWYNPNDAESGDVLFTRWSYNINNSTAGRIGVYFNSGNLRVDLTDDGASSYQGHFGSDGTQDTSTWHCGVILRRGNNLEIWIDGVNYKNAALDSNADGSYTNTSAVLEIGNSPNMGSADAGIQLALLRASASAPSAEQIKKMYEDEKVLFQENASCTLYGSSDAVTALAYDDSTNLLYAGTSSGRSDFQGLRRINNTTTAVTTAISASNGLVAEQ